MNTFTELAEHYLAGRKVSPAYERHVRAIAKRAGTIGSDKLNRYLARRLEQVSGITARNERTILLSVWCHAYHSGKVEEAPRGIGKLRARRKPTKAWTVPQLKLLRRSGATHCEMEQAGSGRLHLGHRSPALFETAYCDWSQLRTKTPRTPALV